VSEGSPLPARRGGVRVSLDLTDGCNFGCVHCFKTIGSPARLLDLDLIRSLLDQLAALRAVSVVALTGGEPLFHPDFAAIARAVAERGFRLAVVSNGWELAAALPALEAAREQVDAVSVSLDGATETTHDALRRREGSFRRAVEGLVLCRARGLATQVNMVVTPGNRRELHAMALLASHLGCRALGLAHCKPTAEASAAGLVMDPFERLHLEADIAALQSTFNLPILLAGDHYDPYPLALCPQLELRELHVDHRGRLTACCELTGYRDGEPDSEVVADLAVTPLVDALRLLADRVAAVIAAKIDRLAAGDLDPADLFICTCCQQHYRKAPAPRS